MLRPILGRTNYLLQTPVKQVILVAEPVRTEIMYSVYRKPNNKCNRNPTGSSGY